MSPMSRIFILKIQKKLKNGLKRVDLKTPIGISQHNLCMNMVLH